MFLVVSVLLSLSFVYAKHEMYDGHALFEVKIEHVKQMEFVATLEDSLQIDIWTYSAREKMAAILVSKKNVEQFQYELHSNGIQFRMDVENIKVFAVFGKKDRMGSVIIGTETEQLMSQDRQHIYGETYNFIGDDVHWRLLDEEDRLMDEARKKNSKSGHSRIGFDRVYNLTEVYTYLDEVAASYPNLVTLVNAGKSFEGKDVKYLKISTTNFEDTSKPIIFVESLLHAREWVTLPPTLYAIDKLVTGNLTEKSLVDKLDWIILPIANPDGYEFSHVENRFWRKNRATGYMANDVCIGVDLNRNFDMAWGDYSSTNVCAETFHGGHPFSEPEAQIIRDIMRGYSNRIKMFLDIHSTGSMILYGWGGGVLVSNAIYVHTAGIQMADAINAVKIYWNPYYVVGNVALVLYKASGLAMDYGTVTGIPFSYVYELPRHRNSVGVDRFLVDPAFVQQAAMETWEGIKAGAKYIRDKLTVI